ncbi:MAG TPA: polyprenyl synthetase family protein [Gemmatimonadaceae bacterium]|nr:polyprenyl synthetase family protein [Gemmatimonadaceae bacterium]
MMVDVSLTPFAAERGIVDRALREVAAQQLEGLSGRVADAVGYALAGTGKRVRGALVLAAYRACGGTRDASGLAAAVEIVHAYSLVHDDLPCMDDDVVRRGRPTVHRAFDVPTASIAGVAMVPLAVRAAYRAARELELSPSNATEIVHDLMRASGATGMVGGQWLDLSAGGETTVPELERMHRMKTGALLRASARIGARAAQAADAIVEAMDRYGAEVGLAFQIVDDVLDVTATSDVLGKTTGSDATHGKRTYPAQLGVAGAMGLARAHAAAARAALADQGVLTDELDALARYAVERST